MGMAALLVVGYACSGAVSVCDINGNVYDEWVQCGQVRWTI